MFSGKAKLFLFLTVVVFFSLPVIASATLIHEATYKWYDVDDDKVIDYVHVFQSAPTITDWGIDLDPTVTNPTGQGLNANVIVEVVEKFWDEEQGNWSDYKDFQWIVVNDNFGVDFSSFHVGNGSVPALYEYSDVGGTEWTFSQDGDSYDWVAGLDDELIDGQDGTFRVAVPSYSDYRIAAAYVNYIDANGDTVLLEGRASQPIPEPGTLILLGSGLVGLAGYVRIRKRKKI